MKRNKLMLPILAVIVGIAASAFTVNNYKSSADNLWYFEYNSATTTYEAITLASSQTPPNTPLCPNTHTSQCDGGFSQSSVTITTNPDGTKTYTPNGTPSVKDYRN